MPTAPLRLDECRPFRRVVAFPRCSGQNCPPLRLVQGPPKIPCHPGMVAWTLLLVPVPACEAAQRCAHQKLGFEIAANETWPVRLGRYDGCWREPRNDNRPREVEVQPRQSAVAGYPLYGTADWTKSRQAKGMIRPAGCLRAVINTTRYRHQQRHICEGSVSQSRQRLLSIQ